MGKCGYIGCGKHQEEAYSSKTNTYGNGLEWMNGSLFIKKIDGKADNGVHDIGNKDPCSTSPGCGAANEAGVKFCRECGSKLEVPAPVPAKRFCTSCGTELAQGVRFCPECGQKYE